ncbi:MAG: FadR family transcriptional regulator [Solirubrobacterales bacterium]|nr:FadR family transcriptional regulator [Solirubrobacterales bacterium]
MQHVAMDAATSRLDIPPAYEVVVDRLRRTILLSIYRPGDKFPPERVHAEQLGVSRVTLREAIRVLEGEGLVETRRGATGGVTVLDRRVSVDALRRRLRDSLGELEGVSDFRLANERCAAERAATRITREQLEGLEASINAMRDCESVAEFRAADSSFHIGVAQAADCALLRRAVEDARIELFTYLDALDYELALPTTISAHRRILAALRTGDPKRAGRAMGRHLTTTWAEALAVIEEPAG